MTFPFADITVTLLFHIFWRTSKSSCLKIHLSTLPRLYSKPSDKNFRNFLWSFLNNSKIQKATCHWGNNCSSCHGKSHWNNSGKAIWQQTKMNSFVSKYCWKSTEDTAEYLKKQVWKQVKRCGRFAIQLSESTEVFNFSHLVVFAFQQHFNNEMHKDFFFFVSHWRKDVLEIYSQQEVVSWIKNNVL